ncbi:MAG: diphosphomevalonate decarboxylase, partial [Zetaproteobacteria bacterium]|nr:diphosphomevalonate decarboxylase [Zetaproteobacteria bacterium]
AWASPFFRPRLAGLGERLAMLQQALAQCDMDALGQWIEADALEMHAVMMTGSPAVQYLSERSLELVAWLRQLRQRTNLQAYFTIDAGPNIHIISPLQQQPTVVAALQEAFADLELILDRVGSGPRFCTNMLS